MAADNDKNPDVSDLEKSIQEKLKNLEAAKQQPTVQYQSADSESWWIATNSLTVSSSVLIFGTIIILMVTGLLHIGMKAESVLKLFGTIIIVIFSVFLMVLGYSETEISPVLGLLGTLAGYLLGREGGEKSNNKDDNNQDSTDKNKNSSAGKDNSTADDSSSVSEDNSTAGDNSSVSEDNSTASKNNKSSDADVEEKSILTKKN